MKIKSGPIAALMTALFLITVTGCGHNHTNNFHYHGGENDYVMTDPSGLTWMKFTRDQNGNLSGYVDDIEGYTYNFTGTVASDGTFTLSGTGYAATGTISTDGTVSIPSEQLSLPGGISSTNAYGFLVQPAITEVAGSYYSAITGTSTSAYGITIHGDGTIAGESLDIFGNKFTICNGYISTSGSTSGQFIGQVQNPSLFLAPIPITGTTDGTNFTPGLLTYIDLTSRMSSTLQWMPGVLSTNVEAGLYYGTMQFGGVTSPGRLIINSDNVILGNITTDPLGGLYGGFLSGNAYQPDPATSPSQWAFNLDYSINTYSVATGYGSLPGGSFSGSFSGYTLSGDGTSSSTPPQTGMISFSLINNF